MVRTLVPYETPEGLEHFRIVHDSDRGTLEFQGSPFLPGNETGRYVTYLTLGPGDQIASLNDAQINYSVNGTWRYNVTPRAIPAKGELSTDTGSAFTANFLLFNKEDDKKSDFSSILLNLSAGDRILGQQVRDSSNRAVFEVVSITDAAQHVTVEVKRILVQGDTSAAWQSIVCVFPI